MARIAVATANDSFAVSQRMATITSSTRLLAFVAFVAFVTVVSEIVAPALWITSTWLMATLVLRTTVATIRIRESEDSHDDASGK